MGSMTELSIKGRTADPYLLCQAAWAVCLSRVIGKSPALFKL